MRRIADPRATMVSDQSMRHVDPLVDFPEHNRFLQTVVPFLRGIVASSH